MELKLFFSVFASVFIAELGDKTQIATLLFSSDHPGKRWIVFVAASAALVTTSALGVFAGGFISRYVSPQQLNLIAGIGFLAIGAWILLSR